MKRFLAVLYKDFRLFLSGTGPVVLLLPFVLIFFIRFFFLSESDSLLKDFNVKPFPVAIRDEDNTLMSRSLTSQVRDVELFSEVYKVRDETDEELMQQGYIAVTTIPKDFFYEMYVASYCPAVVTLNEDKPLEAALYRAVFTSVIDVVKADQAAIYTGYLFAGEEEEAALREIYARISGDLFRDLLGRQQVFDDDFVSADTAMVLVRRLLATVLSVLILFYMTAAAKTIPSERRQKILARYHALGGHTADFALSRYLTALLLLVPASALSLLLFPKENTVSYAVVLLVLSAATYCLMAGIACACKYAITVQWIGNGILLLSMTIGGTLWPSNTLPDVLQEVRSFTLPYQMHKAFIQISYGVPLSDVLNEMLPIYCLAMIGILCAVFASVISLRGTGNPAGKKMGFPDSLGVPSEQIARGEQAFFSASYSPRPFTYLGIAGQKLLYLTRGIKGLVLLLALALVIGGASSYFTKGEADNLVIDVVIEEESDEALELVALLEEKEGIRIREYNFDRDRSTEAMLFGETEGFLVVKDGFTEYLMETDKRSRPLHYESAEGAFSAQGAREIIAATVSVMRAEYRARSVAAERLGRELTEEETAQIKAELLEREAALPALYELQTAHGRENADPFVPGQMAFALFAEVMFLFTAASGFQSGDHRRVTKRVRSAKRGRLLSGVTDALSLFCIGLMLAPCLLFKETSVLRLLTLLLFVISIAALSLVLSMIRTRETRVDALAPMAALFLCLLGGCFMDLSGLSDAFQKASSLLPTGMALSAAAGSASALRQLCLVSVALVLCYGVASFSSSETSR